MQLGMLLSAFCTDANFGKVQIFGLVYATGLLEFLVDSSTSRAQLVLFGMLPALNLDFVLSCNDTGLLPFQIIVVVYFRLLRVHFPRFILNVHISNGEVPILHHQTYTSSFTIDHSRRTFPSKIHVNEVPLYIGFQLIYHFYY